MRSSFKSSDVARAFCCWLRRRLLWDEDRAVTRREPRRALWKALFAPTETKPRPAHEIALDARRAKRLQEDERRASERLYPGRRYV